MHVTWTVNVSPSPRRIDRIGSGVSGRTEQNATWVRKKCLQIGPFTIRLYIEQPITQILRTGDRPRAQRRLAPPQNHMLQRAARLSPQSSCALIDQFDYLLFGWLFNWNKNASTSIPNAWTIDLTKCRCAHFQTFQDNIRIIVFFWGNQLIQNIHRVFVCIRFVFDGWVEQLAAVAGQTVEECYAGILRRRKAYQFWIFSKRWSFSFTSVSLSALVSSERKSFMPDGDAKVMCEVNVFKTSTLDVSESELPPFASGLHVDNRQEIRAMQHCSLRYLDIFCGRRCLIEYWPEQRRAVIYLYLTCRMYFTSIFGCGNSSVVKVLLQTWASPLLLPWLPSPIDWL